MAEEQKKPNGDEREIKPQGDHINVTSESKILRWLDNFWYHYKWHTLIVLFAVLLIWFVTGQAANDPKEDTIVAYCGSFGFLSEETEAFREALNRTMPEDFDGNGEKYVEIVRYQVFSDQELTEYKKALEELVKEDPQAGIYSTIVNESYSAKQLSDFNNFIMLGEVSVFFLSEYMYDNVRQRGMLVPLTEVLTEVPSNAYDEYAVYLCDTPVYALEPGFQQLPDDTLICIAAPFKLGSSSNPETYENSCSLFRALVSGEK